MSKKKQTGGWPSKQDGQKSGGNRDNNPPKEKTPTQKEQPKQDNNPPKR